MVLFPLFHFYLLIAAAVILDFFQLQLEVAFSNGAKKKKSRKKLNFVRESQQEEDDVKQKKKKICVWLLARGGKREKVTVKQLFCYLMSF
jgi:hypothetical protein